MVHLKRYDLILVKLPEAWQEIGWPHSLRKAGLKGKIPYFLASMG